jgi:ABC-type methionine transport system permease subunit
MQNLAEVLDHLLVQEAGSALSPALLKLWATLPLMPMNPAFANAVTRASGAIVATLSMSGNIGAGGLSKWGYLVAEAGREDKVRHAQ